MRTINDAIVLVDTRRIKKNVDSVEKIKKFRNAVARFLEEIDAIDGIGEGSTGKHLYL